MKKFLKLSAIALLLCLAAVFVSCANDDDDDDDDSSSPTGIAKYENVRFGTAVTGKSIFKFYTVLSNNKVRYEQIKYGNYTSDVTSDYTEVKNSDGTITLKLSNGVQKIKNADGSDASFGDEDITFDFSTGTDTPTLTSSYYERGEPVESTGQFTRVYSGIENVIGNTFVHAVSGKSISSSYNFNADGTAEYKLTKYSKLNDYGKYKYTITAPFRVTAENVNSSSDEETAILKYDNYVVITGGDLNTYAVHLVYAETKTYELEENDYSQGYGNATTTTEKSVKEGDEPESPYILIKLTSDDAAKITVIPVTNEEKTTESTRNGTTTTTTNMVLTPTTTTAAGGTVETSETEYALYTE